MRYYFRMVRSGPDIEADDPIVEEVGDINLPRAVQRDTGRVVELPAAGAETAKGGEGLMHPLILAG